MNPEESYGRSFFSETVIRSRWRLLFYAGVALALWSLSPAVSDLIFNPFPYWHSRPRHFHSRRSAGGDFIISVVLFLYSELPLILKWAMLSIVAGDILFRLLRRFLGDFDQRPFLTIHSGGIEGRTQAGFRTVTWDSIGDITLTKRNGLLGVSRQMVISTRLMVTPSWLDKIWLGTESAYFLSFTTDPADFEQIPEIVSLIQHWAPDKRIRVEDENVRPGWMQRRPVEDDWP